MEQEEEKVKFSPALYIQRYFAVNEVIEKYHNEGMDICKLLDVGCAEAKYLKRATILPFLKQICGLDIDKELLSRRSVSSSLEPLITDYLLKRKCDLSLKVYAGNIVERDPIMLGMDVVTAIEVIEHLHPPVLDGFVSTVFSYLRPKLIIITTPNSEFNVLFPNFSGMRHWDHKFEWTRKEFQAWGDSVCFEHGYSVEYGGIGDPPAEHTSVGHCSQMAVFTINKDNVSSNASSDEGFGSSTKYEEMFSTVYIGHNLTDSELLDCEITSTISDVSFRYIQDNEVDDLSATLLPIEILLLSRKINEQLNATTLAERLEHLDYSLTADKQHIILNMVEPESESEEENLASGEFTEPGYDSGEAEPPWD